MENITKSGNKQGNPYHVGKGSSKGGQFTSAEEANGSEAVSKRGHIENPVYKKLHYLIYDYDGPENSQEYEKMIDAVSDEYNKAALPMIMEDTGYNETEAQELLDTLNDYLGGDYEAFSSGLRQKAIQVIDEGISKMPKYDGTIMRGAHFDSTNPKKNERFKNLMSQLKPGAELAIRNTPTSWTSDEETARYFGRDDQTMYDSVYFVCDNNKSGASVQHVSKFGAEESEILVPSNTRYRITKVATENKKSKFYEPSTKSVIVFVEEI